jgi:hypothetical protein
LHEAAVGTGRSALAHHLFEFEGRGTHGAKLEAA